MLVIVGLVVLVVAVIVGFTGVLTNAGPAHPLTRELRGVRLSRHRVDRHAIPVRDRDRRGGDAGTVPCCWPVRGAPRAAGAPPDANSQGPNAKRRF